MSKTLNGAQAELAALLGPWVRFDRLERKLYSHDIGVMPGVVKPLTGAGLAGAVAQPASEEELVKLLDIARRHSLSVTPRGAGTAGYGGAIPAEGAVVIETRRLAGIVSLDREALTVKIKAGTVWKDLEEELGETGLALRLYPSSAPSSTVGGWLAQGGTGYGGYAYGWFKDNVVSAKVVLPNGTLREFSADELNVISDANGITGVVVEVTIKVRELSAEKAKAVAFADEEALARALDELSAAQAPLFSVGFINPAAARLKAKLPPKTHHGHPIHEHKPVLPEKYIAVFVYRAEDAPAAEAAIAKVASYGEALSDDVAEHEWAERFNPMKVKRIAPSLIASEFVVPVAELGPILRQINNKISHPFVVEGTLIKGGEVVILGLIPHDERSVKFTLAYGLSLSAAKIAKANGGRLYTTGMYFRREAPAVLGTEHAAKLAAFKAQVDPTGYFNPGKVIGSGLLDRVMGLAEGFDGLIRAVGNLAKAPVGERFGKEKNGVPADLAWYAYACAQCGYCEEGCTQFYGRGWQSHSPRGKWYFLKEVIEGREKMTQADVDRFMVCTTCERCDIACQLDLPVEPSWMKLRGKFIGEDKKMTFPAFEMMAASSQKERNIWAAYAEDRDGWLDGEEEIKKHIKDKADVAYFAGCTASYVETDISKASATLLAKAGVDFAYLGKEESCCGIPMLVAGRWDVFEEIMRHNVDKMKETGAKTVVTSCPACWLVWHTVYPDWAKKLGIDYSFETKHYSEVLADKIAAGDVKFDHEVPIKVTFHDSCHIGRAGGVYEPPRELLKAIPGVELVEMKHNRENGLCCGSVLTMLGETPVAPKLGKKKLDEAVDTGAEAIVALCPCCQFQMRVAADKNQIDLPVKDLAALAAKGFGVELPDSTPEALYQWSIFEKMIELMKPEPMVALMDKLMPELVAAMPGPFPAMMRAMAKVPGALEAMRPIMPKMMPLMLPGMMPKVMPAMLKEVAAIVGPMPDYMSEQMGDLLPATMEALMPNMLPMIAPGVTDKMIACLKGGCTKRVEAVRA